MNHRFQLKNAALLMALAAIYPLAAHSAAGVAQFAVGDVNVRRGAATLPLAKGQAIDSGDNIVTGPSGQTQLRFTDGGLVSLSPNSQFNITKYVDDNDPAKDSFAVSFLRGGMRAITGLIGKRNRENYKVTTNTATIGIRGSAFSARHNDDGSLDVAGEQDSIVVCTNAGCIDLTVGEIVRVTSNDQVPRRTSQRSNVPPLVARQDLFVPENPAEINPPALPTLLNGEINGMSAVFAFGDGGVDDQLRGGQNPSDGVATFVAGQLVQHVGSSGLYSGGSQIVQKTSAGAGTFGFIGGATDPALIGWGYAGSLGDQNMQVNLAASQNVTDYQGVHYLVGRPTPIDQMPATGAARFALVGGTNPTAFDYETSTLRVGTLVDASLNVNFGLGRLWAQVNTSFNVDGSDHAVSVSNFGQIDGAFFRSDGCGNGVFSGFFTGDQASRAGLVYGAFDGVVGDVRGAVVFVNGGGGGTGMSASFASTDGDFFNYYTPNGNENESTGAGYFVGNQLVLHDDGEGDVFDASVMAVKGTANSFGSLGNVNDADFIGWGYWGDATSNGQALGVGVHHVVGRPTPVAQMQQSGTASYELKGWTNPTAYMSGTLLTGELTSAGLNVDFGNGGVNAFFNTRFTTGAGQTVPVQIAGVGFVSRFYDSNTESDLNGATFYSDG